MAFSITPLVHPSLINSDCVWGWKRTRFVLCSSVESELVPHDFTFVSNYRHESEIMGHSTQQQKAKQFLVLHFVRVFLLLGFWITIGVYASIDMVTLKKFLPYVSPDVLNMLLSHHVLSPTFGLSSLPQAQPKPRGMIRNKLKKPFLSKKRGIRLLCTIMCSMKSQTFYKLSPTSSV